MTLTTRRQQRQIGFTLVELLMVIVILGFLVGMVMPFANHQEKQTKIRQTNAIFQDIRMAILGARNSFDAEGNRVIGGYVGDVGHLPKLYVFKWDETDDEWTHPDTTPADSVPDATSNYDSDEEVYGDDHAEPVALWQKTLPGDPSYETDILVKNENGWNGPYMARPKDPFPDDSIGIWEESLDDDQRRRFYLHEGQGRLTDAWGRALIIYAENGDTDSNGNPLNLVFVSAGPNGRYDASDPADKGSVDNEDNLVLKISQSEWYTPYDTKEYKTQIKLKEIKRAIVGQLPNGTNNGYTGDVLEWPKLFRWEVGDETWDDKDTSAAYTKGQPRGLWTRTPNGESSEDNIERPDWSQPGIGWRRIYLSAPEGKDENQFFKDAWGRGILFFKDDTNDYLILLSRGGDGKFKFGTVDAESEKPADFTEPLDYENNYHSDDASGFNEDNIVEVIKASDWKSDTVALVLKKFTVKNADAHTRAYFFYNDSMNLASADTANTLQSSVSSGDWIEIAGSGLFGGAVPCQRGIRALVFWQDDLASDLDNGTIDTDERRFLYRVDIKGSAAMEIEEITVDTAWFKAEAEAPLP
jgi:prepilin-type N-terminal cleavage/methylation domain-containing protein